MIKINKEIIFIMSTAFILVISAQSCAFSNISAEKIFKIFIADPIPENVKNIRGGGTSWLDFSAEVSFETDYSTFNRIVKDYEIIPRQIIGGKYFSKDIMTAPDAMFYYKSKVPKGEQTYDYLAAWDKKNNMAYFYIGQAAILIEDKKIYEEFYSHVKKIYNFSTEATKKQLETDVKSGKISWDTDVELIREKYGEPDLIKAFKQDGKTCYMLFYDGTNLVFMDNKLISTGIEGNDYILSESR